jgi:hypothetical protein
MTKDELAGFVMTPEIAEQYFLRVIEAEKVLGKLSVDEKIVILKSMASPLTLEEVTETIAGKRVLIVKEKE